MADEAKQISAKHQSWMIKLLKDNDGKVSYEALVEEGENQQCDTVGAMLKILKKKKVVNFEQQFLMYPMHKEEIITLLQPDYDPLSEV